MRWLLAGFICYAAWVVQTTVAPHLALAGVTPRCLPIALALLVWTQTPRAAVVWGMVAGIGFDLLGEGPPGVETGVSVALAATFGWCRRRGIWMMPQMLLPLGMGIVLESCAAVGALVAAEESLHWPEWRDVVTHATLSSTVWGGGFLAVLAGLWPRRSLANSSG
jgi:rod shape-determining protein MreD